MKRTKTITAIFLTGIMMIATISSFAQRGQSQKGQGMKKNMQMHQNCFSNIPDLTEEQENQIEEIKISHMKEMKEYYNKLNEKRARLRTLQTKDNPDMDEINSEIEEMEEIRTEKHKARAKHHQEVRSLLNEEQKVYFDKHKMKMNKGMHHKNMKKGKGRYGGCGRM
ncbi:MAG: Spy/CpxP family protein refolding chaperone [Bacteroidota bacterium]